MALGKWFLSASLVFATGSFLIAADPMPATQPADAKTARKVKVVEPWSMLKDLTPEQTAQIEKIHGVALEQAEKIRVKERDDITALLTPQQLAELKAAEAKKAMDAKEKKAEKLKDAATKPLMR